MSHAFCAPLLTELLAIATRAVGCSLTHLSLSLSLDTHCATPVHLYSKQDPGPTCLNGFYPKPDGSGGCIACEPAQPACSEFQPNTCVCAKCKQDGFAAPSCNTVSGRPRVRALQLSRMRKQQWRGHKAATGLHEGSSLPAAELSCHSQ